MAVDGRRAAEGAYGRMGHSIPRVEDLRLLTGKSEFTDDLAIPGALYAVFVRSPHAHALIRAIDTAAALRLGATTVFTGEDLVAAGVEPILNPNDPLGVGYPSYDSGLKNPPWRALAVGRATPSRRYGSISRASSPIPCQSTSIAVSGGSRTSMCWNVFSTALRCWWASTARRSAGGIWCRHRRCRGRRRPARYWIAESSPDSWTPHWAAPIGWVSRPGAAGSAASASPMWSKARAAWPRSTARWSSAPARNRRARGTKRPLRSSQPRSWIFRSSRSASSRATPTSWRTGSAPLLRAR